MYVKNSDIQVHVNMATTVRLLSVDRTILGKETATIEVEGSPHTLRLGEALDIVLSFDRSLTQNV